MSDSPRTFIIPTLTVLLQPEETTIVIDRHKVKTVGNLLKHLGLRQGTALVARGQTLLTPDQPTLPYDNLLVRKVVSSG